MWQGFGDDTNIIGHKNALRKYETIRLHKRLKHLLRITFGNRKIRLQRPQQRAPLALK
jgi:hypothetical protein